MSEVVSRDKSSLRYVVFAGGIILLLASAFLAYEWFTTDRWAMGYGYLKWILGFACAGGILVFWGRKSWKQKRLGSRLLGPLAIVVAFVVTLAFAFMCLFVFIIASPVSSSPPPTDRQMIDNFTENRSDFETLVEMMVEDTNEVALFKVHRDYVKYYESEQEDTVDQRRIQEYRTLLKKLNLLSIAYYQHREESFVITAYAAGGIPDEGIYKGYEYFPGGLPARFEAALVDSLEYDPKTYEPGTSLYREIDGNWYLWFLY